MWPMCVSIIILTRLKRSSLFDKIFDSEMKLKMKIKLSNEKKEIFNLKKNNERMDKNEQNGIFVAIFLQ